MTVGRSWLRQLHGLPLSDGFQESRGFHTIASRFANNAQILFFIGGLASFAFAFETDKGAVYVASKQVRAEEIETGYHAATAHEGTDILDLSNAILLLLFQRKSVQFVEYLFHDLFWPWRVWIESLGSIFSLPDYTRGEDISCNIKICNENETHAIFEVSGHHSLCA